MDFVIVCSVLLVLAFAAYAALTWPDGDEM
jgi:hypothetical protein